MLKKVIASGRAEAHCFTTWHEGLRKIEEAQAIFNKAMSMAASETMPVDMKAQLSDFVASVYNLQAQAIELFEELREVDPGAPPAPKEIKKEEK